jgi:ATP-dependent Clp protease ATP-binding subunit ClpC
MQPIKKAIDFKKYFSNELNNLLDNMMLSMANENPVSEITTEFFLMYALEAQDSMLYKAVNSFLNSFAIDNIHNTFYLKVQDTMLSAIRPGRTIDYSAEFTNYLSKSNEEKDKLNCKLITSDHILLAILNDQNNVKLNKIFSENGLTYETLFEKTSSLHALTDEIASTDNDKGIRSEIKIYSDHPIDFDEIDSLFSNITPPPVVQKAKKAKSQVPYCKELNKLAEEGKIDSIIGRDEEILKIEKIFARRKCNNVIIVGKSGVGKTALIEGISKKVVERTAPLSMLNFRFFSLKTTELVSGTNLRGMFEDRVGKVFNELKNIKNSVLFIDDAHTLISEKKNDEYGLIDLISEYIFDDSVKIILSTTEKGYKTILSSGENVMRKFQKVTLEGTSEKDTLVILENIKKYYEKYHNVLYPETILSDTIKLSKRYIPEVSLPTSAIDIMDEVGALRKLKIKENDEIKEKMLRLSQLKDEKDLLIRKDDIDEAKKVDEEVIKLTNDIAVYLASLDKPSNEEKTVTEQDLYEAISQHTDIPVSKINVSEKKALSSIGDILKETIVGQDEAVTAIANAIKRSKVGLYPSNKPLSTLMLIGPSGVGKTLTAKTLAKEIFGDEKYLVRFDMSEYSDKTSVNKLIGSNAGYVGYDNGGLLTEAIKNKKHAVLLIDEIEKADDEVFNIFLQIFDEGFLTDNQGNKVDFKNTIILLTSNVGAKRAANEKTIGFNIDSNADKKEIITKELKNKFPPEFINRIDEIIYYNELSDDNIKNIIKLELTKLGKRVMDIGYSLTYPHSIVNYIFDIVSKEREYGARPIVRAIQNKLETKITDFILENEDTKLISFGIKDNEIIAK